MYCTSSTLPREVACPEVGQVGYDHYVQCTTYTGISGAADGNNSNIFSAENTQAFTAQGWVSTGGVLIEYRGVSINEISDGLSNTIAVGEQSDFLSPRGSIPTTWNARSSPCDFGDCRSDCGHGFTMGPAASSSATDNRTFNLTCVYHPINFKSRTGYGIPNNCGPNSPIQSVHPGGANVAFADGSVHMLSEMLDMHTLQCLATRNDGMTLGKRVRRSTRFCSSTGYCNLKASPSMATSWNERHYNMLFAAQSLDVRRLRYYSPMEGRREYFAEDTYC